MASKVAIAIYGATVAFASATLAPQLESVRHWAQDKIQHWSGQQPALQQVQEWFDKAQSSVSTWRANFEAVAQESRDTARSGDNTAHSNDQNFAQCAEQIPSNAPLGLGSVGTRWLPVALCSDGFAVLYSGLSKTPIVTVERLNRQRLQEAANKQRTDRFYADARLRASYKADLSDYQGSGYDRGHMAAAANQYTETGMAQSFALSNMVPQDPTNNRKIWSKLESDVRKYTKRASGNIYVYSGPLFESDTHTIGRNQVWVPSHLFKLVFDEQQKRAWGWVLPNNDSAQLGAPMTYAHFVERTGRNFLPQLH